MEFKRATVRRSGHSCNPHAKNSTNLNCHSTYNWPWEERNGANPRTSSDLCRRNGSCETVFHRTKGGPLKRAAAHRNRWPPGDYDQHLGRERRYPTEKRGVAVVRADLQLKATCQRCGKDRGSCSCGGLRSCLRRSPAAWSRATSARRCTHPRSRTHP